MVSGFREFECPVESPIDGLVSGMTCVSCHPNFCMRVRVRVRVRVRRVKVRVRLLG